MSSITIIQEDIQDLKERVSAIENKDSKQEKSANKEPILYPGSGKLSDERFIKSGIQKAPEVGDYYLRKFEEKNTVSQFNVLNVLTMLIGTRDIMIKVQESYKYGALTYIPVSFGRPKKGQFYVSSIGDVFKASSNEETNINGVNEGKRIILEPALASTPASTSAPAPSVENNEQKFAIPITNTNIYTGIDGKFFIKMGEHRLPKTNEYYMIDSTVSRVDKAVRDWREYNTPGSEHKDIMVEVQKDYIYNGKRYIPISFEMPKQFQYFVSENGQVLKQNIDGWACGKRIIVTEYKNKSQIDIKLDTLTELLDRAIDLIRDYEDSNYDSELTAQYANILEQYEALEERK